MEMERRTYCKPEIQKVELVASTAACWPCRSTLLAPGPSQDVGVGDCQVGDGQQCYHITS